MSREVTRLIQLLLSVGFYGIWWTWQWFHRILGRTPPGICLVLYYHALPANHQQRFARQMDALLKVATPVVADFTAPLEDGVHYVAVTFDDGFRSVIANALPELAQRNIPTTLFVPSGSLGQKPQWLEEETHPDASETVLTAEELQKVVSDFVVIGSHTVTHPNLLLLSEEEIKTEFAQSREELSRLVATDVNLLSFPYGAYDENVVELARQAGYRRVFTTFPTVVQPAAYTVGRVNVQPTDWPVEFFLKLRGAYRWLPLAFRLKHKVRSLLTLGMRTLRIRSYIPYQSDVKTRSRCLPKQNNATS